MFSIQGMISVWIKLGMWNNKISNFFVPRAGENPGKQAGRNQANRSPLPECYLGRFQKCTGRLRTVRADTNSTKHESKCAVHTDRET